MDVLNNVQAPDGGPTPASTLDQTPGYSRALIDVSNAAIYWQVKVGSDQMSSYWTPASGVFMPPGSRRAPSPGRIFGFRFWAAVPAAQLPAGQAQARVTVTLA